MPWGHWFPGMLGGSSSPGSQDAPAGPTCLSLITFGVCLPVANLSRFTIQLDWFIGNSLPSCGKSELKLTYLDLPGPTGTSLDDGDLHSLP
ncbi:hypothetical protein PAXRUDRAFT_19323 [Paxillus rubicundulus Ve08.2h10]|uniref:Unplaced genomic scaffold scaffold_3564, whole genome shotgun sequence n=1 Tax=Paxillus rubicundulus Ve08.2h10 TaxID=930991 RepID=A0A0D0D4W7_9AGAM|nr:hypothetical protein PAXRUDRAFT_19323 [Paxillus rubicundulus Ve08.2h10]